MSLSPADRRAHIYPWGGISQDTRLGYMGVLRRTGRMQTDTKPKVLNRLSRIEGQVRGISRMVEDDRYCVDLLTQLQAVRAALHRVETEVLRDHLDHCVMGAMTGDDPEDRKAKAGELIELLARAGR
nr:metal-sensitive transcriptional regulator [Brevundimonas vesicularis]